jgi:hypothetical protein
MHFLEVKSKLKSGKENELNQVLTDLIPLFKSMSDLNTEIDLNDTTGELTIKFSNGDNPKKINELMEDKNFVLLLGSLKVLCDGYTIIFPNVNDNKNNFIIINKTEDIQ